MEKLIRQNKQLIKIYISFLLPFTGEVSVATLETVY